MSANERTVAPLDRRFRRLGSGAPEIDLESFGLRGDSLGWTELLELSRVIVLAEAGSGKSTELRAAAKRLADRGSLSVFLSVQDVGREGLIGAMDVRQRPAFEAWRAGEGPAWFFIDSIDEGKDAGVPFETALRKIADGLSGVEGRARIVLSGRYHDWDAKADLAALKAHLPAPIDTPPPEPPTPEMLLGKALRHERVETSQPPPAPEPDVLLMAPLDEARIRQFAEFREAPDLDAFIETIAAERHWRFARRPLDLEWMIKRWKRDRALGRLEQMVESSLLAGLEETNRSYQRVDRIAPERGWQALERLGAALVFGHVPAFALSSEDVEHPYGALDVQAILPEWSRADIAQLLARPVFEPGAAGRSRLHSDNEGAVRSYLTARWLHRLLGANASLRDIKALLFAETYGVELVRPALRAVAAWLALWNDAVAAIVAARDPMALIQYGDPAGLPVALRRKVLAVLVDELNREPDAYLLFDPDGLRRFTHPELADDIRAHWTTASSADRVRDMLTLMIWRGRLIACTDLALEAALDLASSTLSRLAAVSAVGELGDAATKGQVVDHVLPRAADMPSVAWQMVDGFFPAHLSLAQLFTVVRTASPKDGYGFRGMGGGLARRITRQDDLETFVRLALDLAKADTEDAGEYELPPDMWREPLTAATLRLLQVADEDTLPAVAAEVMLYLNRGRYFHGQPNDDHLALEREINRTAARRRALFWVALPWIQAAYDEPVWSFSQMQIQGFPSELTGADMGWLATDAVTRPNDHEARLALNAALALWRDDGSPPSTLADVRTTIAARPDMVAILERSLEPQPESPELKAQLERMARVRRERDIATDARLVSWQDFIARVKADPDSVRRPAEGTPAGQFDGVFRSVWELASWFAGGNNRFAIADYGAAVPVFGDAVINAFEAQLAEFWRHATPNLRSARAEGHENSLFLSDQMSISGLAVLARKRPAWASELNADDARKAASFATLELNGFPAWLDDLAEAHPVIVADVLISEVRAALATATPGRYTVLQAIETTRDGVKRAVAPALLDLLEIDPPADRHHLRAMLSILERVQVAGDTRFADLVLARAEADPDLPVASAYFGAAFAVTPERALPSLAARLESVTAAEQTDLTVGFLPKVLGHMFARSGDGGLPVPFAVLIQLVEIAFGTIRPADDNDRPPLEVYTPDPRDYAETARSASLQRLANTPGQATYAALERFAQENRLPVAPYHLRAMALDRALKDSELPAWQPGEVAVFEAQRERAPTAAGELQALALRRLDDIQDDLLTDDFAQGRTFKRLLREEDVQLWIADRLRLKEGISYSTERESERANRKAPDITLRARAATSTATVTIEIKVIDALSTSDIEAALVDQLCARYLRSPQGRHGILLLAYQTARPRGWIVDGKAVGVADLMTHLNRRAADIAAESDVAPAPVVALLDVSSLPVDPVAEAKPNARRTRDKP